MTDIYILMGLMLVVNLAWVVAFSKLTSRFVTALRETEKANQKERQDLLDRIQAPSLKEYKAQTYNVTTPPAKEPADVVPL